MAGYYTPERDVDRVVFSFRYGRQIREASFRDAFLFAAPFGEHFGYDDDGQLTEISVGNGDSLAIERDNNNQITYIAQTIDGRTLMSMNIEYDNRGNVTRTVDHNELETVYTHDNHGRVTSRRITSDDLVMTESTAYIYSNCGQYFTITHTDLNGGVSVLVYCFYRGVRLRATDPNGNTVTYEHCEYIDKMTSVTGYARPGQPTTTNFDTEFIPDYGRIGKITRNGVTYAGGQDHRNRQSSGMVGERVLVTNTYNDNGQIIRQEFANGDALRLEHDDRGRLIAEYWWREEWGFYDQLVSYYYDENDRLIKINDQIIGSEHFEYDLAGRLIRTERGGQEGIVTNFTYDANGAPTLLHIASQGSRESPNWLFADSIFTTNELGLPMDASFLHMGASQSFRYDGLGRPVQQTLNMPAASISTSFEYSEQNRVSSFTNELFGGGLLHEWDFEWDTAGNITSITDMHGQVTSYTFDGLNRLTSEQIGDRLLEYDFDAGGNITRVRENGETLHTFTYGNMNWPDQLTAFNGNRIEYDAMGNPVYYRGYTLTWERGRLLTRMTSAYRDVQFSYDAAGRLAVRQVTDLVTGSLEASSFLHHGNQLIAQIDVSGTMRQQTFERMLVFTYDQSGQAVGFTYNTLDARMNIISSTPYFYLFNLQGDVVAIVDEDGEIVVEYTYDAWGNLLSYDGELASVNPIRYRGKFYETATGFYWMQTRFYCPQWSRFINADSLFVAGCYLTATNMYAYANGNPVMMVDPSGESAVWNFFRRNWLPITIGAAVLVGIAAITTVIVVAGAVIIGGGILLAVALPGLGIGGLLTSALGAVANIFAAGFAAVGTAGAVIVAAIAGVFRPAPPPPLPAPPPSPPSHNPQPPRPPNPPGGGGSMANSQIRDPNNIFIWPLGHRYRISRGFTSYHAGADVASTLWPNEIRNIRGTTVYAAADGIVRAVVNTASDTPNLNLPMGDGSRWGNRVLIEHADGRRTHYTHLLRNSVPANVRVGERVSQGQPIGRVGNSGYSRGYHLHFEVWAGSSFGTAINPLQFFNDIAEH